MIDPHVHLRDWNQVQKETVRHGLAVAREAGLDAVFEMPNTDPPIVTKEAALKRIQLADSCGIPIFHGLFVGLTSSESQIAEAVHTYSALFPRVVGLKLFAGSSTGELAVTEPDLQRRVFSALAELNYTGVVAVHCEKESLMRKDLWDPENPVSHSSARPPEAEVASVKDIITFAEETHFQGKLHICHVSVPESVHLIEKARKSGSVAISCGITPHHALLSAEMMNTDRGLLLKVNPPLRPGTMQQEMFSLLKEGGIDLIETDHAPHTLADKCTPREPGAHASGIPGFPIYPVFIRFLQSHGFNEEQIERMTHSRIEEIFGIKIRKTGRMLREDLFNEYEFNPYKGLII